MSNHTPGPWIVWEWERSHKSASGENKPRRQYTVSTLDGSPIEASTRNIANAYLISAAPEMLNEMEKFVFWYDQYRPKVNIRNGDDPTGFIENLDFMIERYREVINKARGK